MKKRSFVFGAILLGISSVLCKVLGAVYKIPLTNILGVQGMGIYYLIFPIYAFLLSITASSFATVIAKKISSAFGKNDFNKIMEYFSCGLILLLVLGVIFGGFLCALAKPIASLQGVEGAYICYVVIAPAIIAVCVQSAFKGLFQGLQDMVPTALSQILEQLVKLSLGFLFAKLMFSRGVIYGALGAIVGVCLAEVISCLFFVVYYFVFKFKNKVLFTFKKVKYNKIKTIFEILKEGLPFVLSSVILPMSLVIDSFLIINALKYLGFEKGFATSLLGVNSGMINTLIGLPTAICGGICVVIIPYISFALNKLDYKSIESKVKLSIKITIFLCVPCILFFSLFSKEILLLLYSGSFFGEASLNLASTLLIVSSINVLYLSLLQITTSILQALNRSFIPVLSLSVALIFKVVFEVFMVTNPYLNIVGAVISNSVCYFVSCAINIFFIKKEIHLEFSFYKLVFCPIICSLISSFGAFVFVKKIFSFSNLISVGLAFLIAGLGYSILIFVLRAIEKEEIKALFNKRNSVWCFFV